MIVWALASYLTSCSSSQGACTAAWLVGAYRVPCIDSICDRFRLGWGLFRVAIFFFFFCLPTQLTELCPQERLRRTKRFVRVNTTKGASYFTFLCSAWKFQVCILSNSISTYLPLSFARGVSSLKRGEKRLMVNGVLKPYYVKFQSWRYIHYNSDTASEWNNQNEAFLQWR